DQSGREDQRKVPPDDERRGQFSERAHAGQGRETGGQGKARQGICREAEEARRKTRAGKSVRAVDVSRRQLERGPGPEGAGATDGGEEGRKEGRGGERGTGTRREACRREEVAVRRPVQARTNPASSANTACRSSKVAK